MQGYQNFACLPSQVYSSLSVPHAENGRQWLGTPSRPEGHTDRPFTWHVSGRPTTLAALLALKRAHLDLRIVGGNTEVGIEVKFKAARYRHLAAPTHIPELTRLEARTSRARRG